MDDGRSSTFPPQGRRASPAGPPPTGLLLLALPLLALPLLALPALWPLLASGLPRASDTALHMARLALLHEHLLAGDLWPRWLPEMTLGYGYLFFSYYAPATYYAAEALQLLGFSSNYALLALSATLIVAAGVTMFFFARDLFFFAPDRAPALPTAATLVAATAAIYNPYLLTNIYERGAFGEAGAMVLLPLILLAVRRIFCAASPRRGVVLLAFALAALALTHTLSLLFAPAVVLGYALVLWMAGARDSSRLAWAGAGFVLAMALSAAFWLPVLAQRDLVVEAGAELARTVRLPASMWTWTNFLDTGLGYSYTFARPVRLGVLQLVLGVAGFILAWRRDREWLYLGGVALVGGVLIGAWALPLWQKSPLVVAQYAWRLLGVVTLPLALFAGGVAYGVRWLPGRTAPVRTVGIGALAAAAALIAIIMFAQRPRIDWIDTFAASATPDRASIAQIEVLKEVATGGEQNSNVQEFRPRGAPAELVLVEQPPAPAPPPTATVVAAGGNALDLRFSTPTTTTLRLAAFYHPNWRVTRADGRAPLRTYPSTSLSLLTVDAPPGEYTLHVRWGPSAAEYAGAAITLAALAFLGAWATRRRQPLLALVTGGLFLLCLLVLSRPMPRAVAAPPASAPADAKHGLRLAGVRVEADNPAQARVLPWWYVAAGPPAGLRVRWVVRESASGKVAGESLSAPWFNTADAQQWPAGALVDDAYALPLPAGLPAGEYDLAFELLAPGERPSASLDVLPVVAHFTTRRALPPAATPPSTFAAQVGDSVRLLGFDLEGADPRDGVSMPVVEAGRTLALTLYWQTDDVLAANYRTFAGLLDAQGRALVQEDHTPGPEFHPTAAWLPGRVYSDRFLLRIPRDAAGGVYAPWVGLRDAAGDRLPVVRSDAPAADEARLPAIKVVQPRAPRPQFPLDARFGDLARLKGYDLSTPEPLRAGESLTVTLFLEALGSGGAEYNRFLQLLDAEGRIVAQSDGPPAQVNPTGSWLRGEVVRDAVALTVLPTAAPGIYSLVTGFYAAGAPDQRLAVIDEDGVALENRALELGTVEIQP